MKMIGISGKMGSGKSTVAKIIEEKYSSEGRQVVIIPFAQEVKRIAYELGWDGNKDKKGRRLLQLIGTECGRQCVDNNLWVKKWKNLVIKELERDAHHKIVIADDIRFNNEAEIVIGYFYGTMINITRPVRMSLKSFFLPTHKSESGISEGLVDYTIDNDCDLIELEKKVIAILKVI